MGDSTLHRANEKGLTGQAVAHCKQPVSVTELAISTSWVETEPPPQVAAARRLLTCKCRPLVEQGEAEHSQLNLDRQALRRAVFSTKYCSINIDHSDYPEES